MLACALWQETVELLLSIFVTTTASVCLLLQYLLQSCSRGGGEIVEDMCYEILRIEACVD